MDGKEIENLSTTYDLTKIPKKKMNYKQLLYRQRLKYGKYIDIGLVIEKLNFSYKNGQFVYQINSHSNENVDNLMEDHFYKSLFYCSDLDFNTRPSKRELKLRKIMNEKIIKLKEIAISQCGERDNNKNITNTNESN